MSLLANELVDNRPETVIIDLDGTLIKHHGSLDKQMTEPVEILPGAKEKIFEWERRGCRILILTGRKESMRALTVKQLAEAGIVYDVLIMGVGGGRRVLINDNKPHGEETALAFPVERNKGIEDVDF